MPGREKNRTEADGEGMATGSFGIDDCRPFAHNSAKRPSVSLGPPVTW